MNKVWRLIFILPLSWHSKIYASQPDYQGAEWIAAPAENFTGGRTSIIKEIVLHTIEDGQNPPNTNPGSLQSAINFFIDPNSGVSSHYLIGANGRLIQMVHESDRCMSSAILAIFRT